MTIYAISYDLRGSGKNYSDLSDAIKSYRRWCHPLKSMWFVSTTKTAFEVASHLEDTLDSDDRLIVNEVTRNASWTENLPENIQNWLTSNL